MTRLLYFALFFITVAAPAAASLNYVAPETTLKDDMTYTVHWDGSFTYEDSVAVRLNTAEAVEDDGEAYIGYSGSLDTVKIFSAYTTTASGQRIDVLPDKIIDQQGDGDGDDDSFSDEKNRVIIFSSLAPGAVEHYHYIINTTTSDFPGEFYTVENFPDDSAIAESSVTVIAPAALPLFFEPDGMTGGRVASPGPGKTEWVYRLRDLPARAPEDDSVGINDYSPRLAVSSFPNFAAVGAAYEERAAKMAAVTPQVRRLADRITAGITSPYAQAEALYNWVSRNIRYVAVDFGDGGYVPNDDDAILAAGYGDCKDHVTLLKALLAAKGIRSSGVLVNWNDEYWSPKVAMPEYNHIITYIPQFNLFADSTAEFAPFGVLPTLERGKQALITGAPGIPSRLVTLPLTSGTIPDMARVVTHETLAADGTVSGGSVVTDSGREELADREQFADYDTAAGQQAASDLMARYDVQGIGSLAAGDPHDLSKKFGYATSFSMPGYAAVPGPGTMPMPSGVPTFNALAGLMRETALPVRTEPVPCAAINTEEITTLSLPAGVRVKMLPADTHFANAIGRYDAVYIGQGAKVVADRHLLLHPLGPTCDPAAYQQMRAIGFAIGRDMRATISY
jgi:hypothetical protein